MNYGKLSAGGRAISRVVLGTGSLGDRPADGVRRLLDAFVAAGGSALDTAAVYGFGSSERAIGSWIASSDRGGEVAILTKGGHPSLPDWRSRLSPEEISADLEGSLERLGVDRVGGFMLHRDDEQIPVGELVEALAEQVLAGRTELVGVSNWSTRRVEAANEYARSHGLPPLSINSVHYSLAAPVSDIAPGTVSLCGDEAERAASQRSGVAVLAWSALGQGYFGARGERPIAGPYDDEPNSRRAERVALLAAERGVSKTAIALAWLLSQWEDLYAVVGPASPAHLADCLAGVEHRLTQSEVGWLNLEAAKRPVPGRPSGRAARATSQGEASR